MNIRWFNSARTAVIASSFIALALSATALNAAAEQKNAASKTKPSSAKLIDGHPDMNGVWINGDMGFVNPVKKADGSVCILCRDPNAKAPPPRVESAKPKYKPEFVEKVKDLSARQVEMDPALKCANPGLPRIGPPEGIVQTPGQIVFLYDDLSGSFFRTIPTDGRPHRANAEETYLGDSVGKWEGDTLVIESVKFIDDFWLTDNGAFHSPGLKVTERLRLVEDGIEYQAIADDPAVLAEPWQMRARKLRRSEEPMHEPLPCVESDLKHVVDGTHHDNAR